MGERRPGAPPFLQSARAVGAAVAAVQALPLLAMLEHYAALAPEALDSLTAEELHKLYKMLRLKVFVAKVRGLAIELAGVPAESADTKSSSAEARQT